MVRLEIYDEGIIAAICAVAEKVWSQFVSLQGFVKVVCVSGGADELTNASAIFTGTTSHTWKTGTGTQNMDKSKRNGKVGCVEMFMLEAPISSSIGRDAYQLALMLCA